MHGWRDRFSEEDVKAAVCELKGDKAPSPDGFPIAFYKIFFLIGK